MIFVDSRETKERKHKAEKLFKSIEIKQLESGDYVYEDKVAVELKTAKDFINSVKSKRIYEQAVRMAETYPHHYIIVYGDMQSAMNEMRYLKHKFSVNQLIGSLSSLSQITNVLQVANESQAFKLMKSLFAKSTDGKNRMVVKPKAKSRNKMIGIVMYLGGMNVDKATKLVNQNNIENLSDLLELEREDIESIKGIGNKTSSKMMRWLK